MTLTVADRARAPIMGREMRTAAVSGVLACCHGLVTGFDFWGGLIC
jgi:hypothetical protein